MDEHQASPVGERVFCHECEHEWVRAQHGLACPVCRSDFTEVLEEGNDPRTESPVTEHAQHVHHHVHQYGVDHDDEGDWEDDDEAPDPDEGDITHLASPHDANSPHGVHPPPHMAPGLHVFTTTGTGLSAHAQTIGRPPPHTSSHGQTTPNIQSPNTPTIPAPVRSIIESIMGSSIFGPQPDATPTMSSRQGADDLSPTRSRSLPHGASGNAFGTTTYQSGGSGPVTWRVTTTHGPSAGFASMMPLGMGMGMGMGMGFPGQLNTDNRHVEVTGNPFSGSTPGPSALSPFPAGLFNVVFGGQGPLAMLAGLVDPANMQHGDAVYSQEALDRIISQLMEQHTSGSAPGPASGDAITALPTRQITVEDLGAEGKAECSICMDEVNLEEQVTVLPCHHWFHGDCVKAWLGEHDTCPHCRQSIMPKASDPDPDRLRSPHEAPRHDHTLGSAVTPGDGTFENPWSIPDSPELTRQTSQSVGPSSRIRESTAVSPSGRGADSNELLYDRMRSAFGEDRHE